MFFYLKGTNKKVFYKSYSKWEKFTEVQKNNTICWFNRLPGSTQQAILTLAADDTTRAKNQSVTKSVATTKDDIARLMHLFKFPGAQLHWSNLSRSLTRKELDARKSGTTLSDAANSYAALAVIFNDYNEFCPQHLMVKYIDKNGVATRKNPYEANSDEWETLVDDCWDIEPTNVSRKNVIRDGAWFKATWTEVRGFLHQAFKIYNR